MRLTASLCGLVCALGLSETAAATDVELPWRGRLTHETGAPFQGEHDLTLSLLDAQDAVLWSKTYADVLFVRGDGQVLLAGDDDAVPVSNPLDSSLFLSPVYLSVSVDGAAPLEVAAAVTSVPRAASVVGSVLLDDSRSTCTADHAGALRWASGAVQACDGAEWQSVLTEDAVSVPDAGAFGSVRAFSSLQSSGGLHRRDIATYRDTASNAVPIHIKTNIAVHSDIRYWLVVDGYNYGVSQPVKMQAGGWTSDSVSCASSMASKSYTTNTTVSQYCSSDGFIVLKLQAVSFYFIGISVGASTFTSNSSPPVSVTFHRQSANL